MVDQSVPADSKDSLSDWANAEADLSIHYVHMPHCWLSHESRHEKTCFCISKNKSTDQLCGNCAADQCLCYCYTDSTIPLLPKSKVLSLLPTFKATACVV